MNELEFGVTITKERSNKRPKIKYCDYISCSDISVNIGETLLSICEDTPGEIIEMLAEPEHCFNMYDEIPAINIIRDFIRICVEEKNTSKIAVLKINPGRGIVFATGTPISNTMSEMYTMQRFLQPDYLKSIGVYNFDDWASTFGQTVSALELAPEGNRYRVKTRFAKFNNIPELMTGFSLVADIQNSETLKLPVPDAERHTIQVLPTEEQQAVMKNMNVRADECRNGQVDPKKDNMLKITNDGRYVSLDPRVFDSSLSAGNKIPAAAKNIYDMWLKSNDGTQIVFCDLSTPKSTKSKDSTSDTYCAYDDLKSQLVEYGIPEKEIQFMQHFKTATAKEKLFSDVRKSKVRVLIGSTSTMGTGTNVQDHLIALHHLDCPYRPADVGRILRTFKIKKNVEVTYNGKIII